MTDYGDESPRFVCHECIGDTYLKAEIQREEKRQGCMICGKKRNRAIAFDEVCERIHDIVNQEFQLTASEPESWAPYKEADIGWDREGETIDEILYEILQCDQPLIDALKEALSEEHHSFDDAAAGEEDPYGDEVHYELCKPNDYEFHDMWSAFESEIRTRARFFSSKAESALDEIFGDLARFWTPSRPLVREVGPGSATELLYRARRAVDNAEIARIVEHPARELGAPPPQAAGSGRMNPRWISMFYGAFDPDTCVSEIRAPVGSAVVIGKFTIIRKLTLLDLDALQNLFVKNASFFDPEFRRLRDKARFLKRLVLIMSRPILPTDEDYHYLPTQAVAEYISEKMVPQLDGLIFPSSQRGGKGENVVLFRRASSVEPDGSDKLEMETDFGWSTEDNPDLDITVWTKKKRIRQRAKNPRGLDPFDEEWSDPRENLTGRPDLTQDPREEAALRVDLHTIEVRDIQEVKYTATIRTVHRHESTIGKMDY